MGSLEVRRCGRRTSIFEESSTVEQRDRLLNRSRSQPRKARSDLVDCRASVEMDEESRQQISNGPSAHELSLPGSNEQQPVVVERQRQNFRQETRSLWWDQIGIGQKLPSD